MDCRRARPARRAGPGVGAALVVVGVVAVGNAGAASAAPGAAQAACRLVIDGQDAASAATRDDAIQLEAGTSVPVVASSDGGISSVDVAIVEPFYVPLG